MTEHAVVIAGGGPTGLMLAAELALAGVDVAIVVRRASQDLVGSRAGGLHSRTIEVLDQRGIADRFLSQGQLHKVVYFHIPRWATPCPSSSPWTTRADALPRRCPVWPFITRSAPKASTRDTRCSDAECPISI
jgi:2-polyprenyl-6-methoxyphenol hydroxylase-like FAD-dependent oxidoreductase